MKNKIMAFDLGTTGIKVVIFDDKANALATEYREYPSYYPHNDWVEQNPDDWWNAFCDISKTLIEKHGIDPNEIAGVAPSGQMSTAIPIDKDGNLLLSPVFIWADMRTGKQVKEVCEKLGGFEKFYDITAGGLATETYSAMKIAWYNDNMPELVEKTWKFLQAKEYVAFRLTGEVATDYTDASDSAMMDRRTRDWSPEILEAIGITADKLPKIYPSSHVMGHVTAQAAKLTGLVEGTPVVVGGGDVSIGAAGAGIVEEGICYMYIGSAMWTGVYSPHTVADCPSRVLGLSDVSGKGYVPHHIVFGGGVCYQWLRDLPKFDGQHEALSYDRLNELALDCPPGADGLIFLPYMRGGGAPHHNPKARGAFIGMGLNNHYGHYSRAVMEGIAFGLREMVEIFNVPFTEVRMAGGGAKSKVWRQIIADITGKKVTTTALTQETNAWGAALCAGVGVGLFEDFTVTNKLLPVLETVEPRPEYKPLYERMFGTFKDASEALVPTLEELAACRKDDE